MLRGITNATWNRNHEEAILELVPESLRERTQTELYGFNEILNAISSRTEDLSREEVTTSLHESGKELHETALINPWQGQCNFLESALRRI